MKNVIDEDIKKVLENKYLSYAISTIISRSLPDIRDGLKPVHRRIIYSMYELNLMPESPFKKSARIVGDVMGKFHPHGDQAIYDSLVRMSQNFSTRYPLIEGQGNFGNIDGDNPAAMRYTEARLDKNCLHLLDGLNQDAVDYIDNYDGQNKEPSVLPSLLPNILLNGSSGIAVGMATNIPSHNIYEICEATIELIKNNRISTNKLLKIVKGPDFPTGADIAISNDNLKNIYNNGRGNFTIKSKWRKINLLKGQFYIEIYEIPYQVNKNKIIENIANLIKNKKIPIDDVWDESDKDIRIIIKPKNRNIQPKQLIEVLFKHTDLASKYHCNFNVLINGKIPKLLGLKDILINFIDHRKSVIKRISLFKINKIKLRIHILEGFIVVYKFLDQIIKIIRNTNEPKKELIKKFKLKEIQVNAILEMKLRFLRKIEQKKVQDELKNLKIELKFLKKLIKNKIKLNKYIIDQLRKYLQNLEKSNSKRRTNIFIEDEIVKNDNSLENFKISENITLSCSEKDNLKIYKGHLPIESIVFNNKEKIKFYCKIKSDDIVLIVTDDGKIYALNPEILPGGKSNGTNFSFFVNLKNFSKIMGIYKFTKNFKCLLVSKNSKCFIHKIDSIPKIQKNGKQIFNLKNDDKLIKILSPIKESIASISSSGKLLIFKTKEIPIHSKSSGVLIQKIKNGSISDIQLFDKKNGLQWCVGKSIKKEQDIDFWIGKRAQVGKNKPKRFSKDLKFNI